MTDADLRDAILNGASMTQTDLVRADLRGAHLWWVGAIQANTAGSATPLKLPSRSSANPSRAAARPYSHDARGHAIHGARS